MTGHLKTPEHRIASVSYRTETTVCSCGAVITALPDAFSPSRHEPLVIAWTAHRKTGPNRNGMVQDAAGRWRRPTRARKVA